MVMNYPLHIGICVALVVLAIAVGLYRKWLEDRCDHYVHLHGDAHDVAVVDAQSAMCRRIDMLDKVKTGLIVAVILYALAIGGLATYLAWNAQGTS